MTLLCTAAVMAALAGLLSVILALGTTIGPAHSLLFAPAFGALSLAAGVAAAVVAMRRVATA